MKRIVKHGFLQGVTTVITLTAISYWINGSNLFKALAIGLVGGLIAGVLNSFLFYKYAVPKYVLDAVSIDLDADEEIKFQTPAVCTGALEQVSGKLFLTNKRLIFKNHKQDKHILQLFVDLQDIDKADTFRTLRFLENGLSIRTTSSTIHTFIVDRLKQWLVQLDKVGHRLDQGVWQNAG